MIVAIERNRFTYLYKYNEIKVDINQIIDSTVENLRLMLKSDMKGLVELFDKSIPLFEQEHEVVLLEIDKSKIKLKEGIVLPFDSVLSIIPLTKIGSQLLEGKISDDFIMGSPVFEDCIKLLQINRSMELRRMTSTKLLSLFQLENSINIELTTAIESAVRKNILDKTEPQKFTTFLDHLIAYNKTPSFIPEGHIENFCKIGVVTMKFMGKQEDVFTNGPYYKKSLEYKNEINNQSLMDSYQKFLSISDDELKSSYERIVDIISKGYRDMNIFKVSYFFLAFKSFINKNDNNVDVLNMYLESLIEEDVNSATIVLSILGYTFSFENIYEGIHRLSLAPLLKSTKINAVTDLKNPKKKISEPNHVKIKINNTPVEKVIEDPNVAVNEQIPMFESKSFSTDENPKDISLLVNVANKNIKGKGSKEVLDFLKEVYSENKEFTYLELEAKSLNRKELCNKNGKPKARLKELLNIFK